MHKFCASGFFCLLDFVGKTNKMMPIDRERSDADMNSLKRTKLAYSILSIVLIVIGIYLIIRPQTAMLTVCRVLGVVLMFYGIIRLLGYFSHDMYQLAFQFDLAMGIFSLVAGCIFLFRTEWIAELIPAFIGVIVLIDAVFKIQTSLDAKKFGISKWWLILILAVIAGALGAMLLVIPLKVVEFVMVLIGINLVIDGVLNFWVVHDTVRMIDSL